MIDVCNPIDVRYGVCCVCGTCSMNTESGVFIMTASICLTHRPTGIQMGYRNPQLVPRRLVICELGSH